MSKCDVARSRTQAVIDRTLDEAELDEYRTHVRECAECAALHAEAALEAAVSAHTSRTREHLDLWPALEKRITDSHRPARPRHLRRLVLASAAAALIGIGVWALYPSPEVLDPSPEPERASLSIEDALADYERAAAALREAITSRGGDQAVPESLRRGLATSEELVAAMRRAVGTNPTDPHYQEGLRLAMKHQLRHLQDIEAITRNETQEGS